MREARPVGAELEFHRDSGNDPHREVDRENLRPEARRDVVARVAAEQGDRFQDGRGKRSLFA